MTEHLSRQDRGPVTVLTLNRPDRLNALTAPLLDDLRAELIAIEREGTIGAVIITGAGRAFSSGADRVAGQGMSAELMLRDHVNPLIETMVTLRLPLLAAVNGVAVGAGASLTFACDLRLAATEAQFILPFVKIGLVPDGGATWLLPRLVGAARAAEMTLLARPVTSLEARDWGLVAEVVEPDRLTSRALELAGTLADATASLAPTKAALLAATTNQMAAQLDLESRLQGQAQQHPDYIEARRKFLERSG